MRGFWHDIGMEGFPEGWKVSCLLAFAVNRMMQQRILYQALAILICVVLLFAMGRT